MLFVGISSALAAIVTALLSWGSSHPQWSELMLIVSVATAFLAAASALAMWLSERPARVEWHNGVRASLWTFGVLAMLPGILAGLIWFFMWVVVPSVLILPFILLWDVTEYPDPARHPILAPQHA